MTAYTACLLSLAWPTTSVLNVPDSHVYRKEKEAKRVLSENRDRVF